MDKNFQIVTDLANEIEAKQISDAIKKNVRWPIKSNWGSTLGHPCLRYKVYNRLAWDQALLPSADLQFVFEEGHNKEAWALRKLQDLGFKVIQQQAEGQKDELFDKLNIGLRIDGRLDLGHDKPKPVVEVKSMTLYDYNSISSYEDMKNHKNWRIKSYCAQGQIYLMKNNVECGLYLLTTYRKPIKAIPFVLDYEFTEKIMKETEQVNRYVAANQYPEPNINLADKIHADCPYHHICPIKREFGEDVELINDDEIVDQLNKREQLQEAAEAYADVDEIVKDYFKNRPKSIAGEWFVQSVEQKRSKYDVPKEIKEQYKQESICKIVKIERIKKDVG